MAGAVLVVGVVVAALLVFSVVDDLSGVSRFSTDRPVEGELSAGEQRTIYSAADGSSFRSEPTCQVVDVVTSQAVATTPATSLTLTLGEDEFRSLAHFRVPRAGRYRIICSADSTRPVPMAVGPRIALFRSVGRIFGAIAVGLVTLALTAVIVAVTAVKRNQRRRRPQHPPPFPST